MQTTTMQAHDGTAVAVHHWEVPGPKAVVQIAHGMGEHAERYDHLARTLNGARYSVVAQDHRGHGGTLVAGQTPGEIGPDGWAGILSDIDQLVDSHGDLPVVLLGHSMGSFAAQQYAAAHADKLRALVLSGTAAIDLLEGAIDLDAPMDLAVFNLAFAPARTDYDWLSRDEAQVDAYVADPLCGFGLDAAGARGMFEGARPLATSLSVPPGFPVYVAVGDQDPVNGQLTLSQVVVDRFAAAGADVHSTVWEGARHEIFNETNLDEVEADLLEWLQRLGL